jgi:acyl-CoA reductase-like NAD-dependent aldehyde dehydrogenase
MKIRSSFAALGAISLALAACDNAGTAVEEDTSESVEAAAEKGLGSVTDEPVEDADVEALEDVEAPPAVSEAEAGSVAEKAAEDVKEAEDALAALEAELNGELDEAKETVETKIDEVKEEVEEIIDNPGGLPSR